MASSSNTPTPTSQLQPPWSLNQIHANASNWSLQGDAQLLATMQNISSHLQRRCTATKTNVDDMLRDLGRANLRLENTANKMLSLKNMQFIEARVRDDIDESMNTAASASAGGDVVSTDATPPPPLTTAMAIRTAVDNGLRMLDRCYEKVTLRLDDDDSDNEDDENFRQSSVIFRSRNPHQDRPLPHLIGSKEWTEKWHVGLVDSDDDDNDNDDNNDGTEARRGDGGDAAAFEEFSSSSSEEDDSLSMSVSLPSNVHTVSGSENSDSHRSSLPSVAADHAANGRNDPMFDMFRPGAEPLLSHGIQTRHTKPSNDIFDDLDSDESAEDVPKSSGRIIGLPQASGQTSSDMQRVKVLPSLPINSGSQASSKTIDAPAPIFRSQAPPPPKPSATYGLFDDDPPELDDAPLVAAKRRPTNIFLDDSDDDVDVINEASPRQHVSSPIVAASSAVVPPKTSNLFDSTDSEPDDVPPPRRATLPVVVQPIVKSNISKLFDDSPPDDLFDQFIAKKSTSDQQSAAIKKSIFDDDDEDLFGNGNSVIPSMSVSTNNTFDETPSRVTIQPESSKPPAKPAASFDDIFGDEPPEDDFGNVFVKSMPTLSPPQQNNTLVNENDKPPMPQTSTIQTQQVTSTKANEKHIFDDIFGDSEHEDEFSSIFAKPKPTLSVPSYPLFDHDDDESSNLESSTTSEPASLHIVETVPVQVITETAAPMPIEDVVQKTTSTPEQYANFYDGSKLVEDRRVFVSYLDNDQPPDFDGEDDHFAADITVKPIAHMADINAAQTTPREDEENITVPPVEIFADIEQPNTATKNAYLFDDEPPEDIFQDARSPNIPTTMASPSLHAAFFDTLPPPDDIQFEKSSPYAKSSSFPSRSSSVNLFNDRPPDDDDTYDDSMAITPTPSVVPPKSMAVFDDLPPDDDLFSATSIVSSSHSTTEKKLFYEDFADTIIAAPPPDIEPKSEVKQTVDIAQATAVKSDQQPSDPSEQFNTNRNRFKHPAVPESIESVPEKPKPKKLNTKLQINVAALLPGAKRIAPSANNQPSVQQQPRSEPDDETDNASEAMSTSRVTNVPENSSGLLVGLNKSRAKITVKRKPSTRLGRQTEYRKSMQIDAEAHETDIEVDKAGVKSIAEMLQCDNDDEEDWLTIAASSKAVESTSTPVIVQSQLPETKTSIPKQPTKHMFSDDDDDDDLFGSAAAVVNKPLPIKTDPSITIPRQVPSTTAAKNTAASLFDSDDSDDDLFGQRPIAKHSNVKKIPADGQQKQQLSLFGSDDDNDDDDLFGASSKTPKISKVPAKPLVKRETPKTVSMLPDSLDPLADLMKNV